MNARLALTCILVYSQYEIDNIVVILFPRSCYDNMQARANGGCLT